MKLGAIFLVVGFIGAFFLGFISSPLTSKACKTYGLRSNDGDTAFHGADVPMVPTPAPTPKLITFSNRSTVILTASVHVNARRSPYLLLILPVARSWAAQGFEVIVVLVFFDAGNTPEHETEFFELLKRQIIAVPNVQLLEFPAPSLPAEISLSQTVRLFLPVLMHDWPPEAYIRLSDSDMMIFQAEPFQPKNINGIDIYNGDCCWPEVPMHAIGMQRKLWLSLFEPYLKQPEGEPWTRASLSMAIMKLLREKFKYEAAFVGHGQKFWGMDQQMAGERVAAFKNSSGVVTTHPMRYRAHWPFSVTPQLTECHLAGIGFGDIMRLKEVVGSLGEGLDVIAAKYNSTWLNPN
jgi:hypothetical protein